MIRIFNNQIRIQLMNLSKYSFRKRKSETPEETISKIQSNVQSIDKQINKIKKSKSKITKKSVNEEQICIDTLKQIIEWRQKNQAPVDVVGCQRLFDRNQPKQIQDYQLLISIFLSVQTKDQTTSKVVEKLIKYGLTPQNILKTPQEKILELIREVNFNKKKAATMLKITQRIKQMGKIPNTLEGLTDLPGVGLKIANIYLKTSQGIITGIGVDTHVHRISNRLGWVDTKNPNETQERLQKLFPKQYWAPINVALVGFGQTICDAKKPKCQKCVVGKVCPSYKAMF